MRSIISFLKKSDKPKKDSPIPWCQECGEPFVYCYGLDDYNPSCKCKSKS